MENANVAFNKTDFKLYALKDIHKNEELYFPYDINYWISKIQIESDEPLTILWCLLKRNVLKINENTIYLDGEKVEPKLIFDAIHIFSNGDLIKAMNLDTYTDKEKIIELSKLLLSNYENNNCNIIKYPIIPFEKYKSFSGTLPTIVQIFKEYGKDGVENHFKYLKTPDIYDIIRVGALPNIYNPIIITATTNDNTLYLLDMKYCHWIINCITFASSGLNPFPSKVQFFEDGDVNLI